MIRQVTALTFMIINNCTPPNVTPMPMHPPPMVPVGTIMSMDSPIVLSGRRNNQTGELANGFEIPLCCHPGRIHSPSFILNSCLPCLMIVCNSFLGYLKVLYHVACLALRRQHVKSEMCWQQVTQVPRVRPNKIGVIAERPPEEAQERKRRGPQKRQNFY